MQPRKIVFLIGVIAFLITLAAIIFALYSYRRPLPKTSGIEFVPGLFGNVTIYRDEWGVPHIFAENNHDLFFAQGYIHAQDRWWQMEMNRHLGMGEMSAILGQVEDAQNFDRFVRAVGWNRIAHANMSIASAESRTVLRSYATGVNAYIHDQDPGELAVQYTMLGLAGRGFEITPWEGVHSLAWGVAFSWSMNGNLSEELENVRLLNTLPPDLLQPFLSDPFMQAWQNSPIGYSGVDTELVGGVDPLNLPYLGAGVPLTSSAWVVDGSRTESGKPLLANDMQWRPSIPSPWYEVGLHCIEITPQCPYDVVGFSLPGIPGVIIGHNAHFAWGITNGQADTQDLYLLRLNPANPLQYEYNGAWRDMQALLEPIITNDANPLLRAVYLTTFGPVISRSPQVGDRYALALRWSGSEENDLVQTVLRINSAENWETFRAALAEWRGVSFDLVYADIDGIIGEQTIGSLPIRAEGASGLLPAAAWDDTHVWQGFVPFDEQASSMSRSSFFTSAAQIGGNPQQTRAERISAFLLDAELQHTPDTFAAIQLDADNTLFVSTLLTQLLALDFSAAEDAKLLDYQNWLRQWDMQMSESSPYPVLYGLLWAYLRESVIADQLDALSLGREHWLLEALLNQPDSRWWDDLRTPDIVEDRDLALRNAFQLAIDAAESQLGELREEWRWGNWHTVSFKSLLLGDVPGADEVLNRGPFGVGGDFDTVYQTPWILDQEHHQQTLSAPAFRVIIDLANFDNSRSILSTGQSGHPASPHYDDMVDLWRSVAYRDMLWDRNRIRDEAKVTLRLRPALPENSN